jgi:hypothetical protein
MSIHGLIICHQELGCYRCKLAHPHYDRDGWATTCTGYNPQPIDEEVYHVVQEEYHEWWGYGEEEWADFISEEASFTQSTWDRLVQRQEQIRSEKEA